MIIRVKRMTSIMRVLHWALAASVVACFITGIYIATPYWWAPTGPNATDAFYMGNIRFIHFVFAMILDVAFIAWFYLFFFSTTLPFVKSLVPVRERLPQAVKMLVHYFTMKNKPVTSGDKHLDPLNAYGFLLIHFFVFVQMLTGFALMAPTFSHANSYYAIWPWILQVSDSICIYLFGTAVATRQVHHLSAFIIIALAMIHIYLQFWRELFWSEGHMSVVFSGYKYIETDKK